MDRLFYLLGRPRPQSKTDFNLCFILKKKMLISMNYNIDFCEQMLIVPTWVIRLYGFHENIINVKSPLLIKLDCVVQLVADPPCA